MMTVRTCFRLLIPALGILYIFSCSANEAITTDMVSSVYSDYRKGKKQALNNLISYYRDPALSMEVRKL